ncbi:MAG TPA: hypothetical protein VJZ72_09430 [Candidatus Limnocylindrales bacterium]|nr:hypothetical protein [Candidatus Limnocylindrales bacterium]
MSVARKGTSLAGLGGLRRLMVAVTGALVAVAFVGCTGGSGGVSPTSANPASAPGAAPSAAGAIVAEGFAFRPATVSVPAGGSLTFANRDAAEHTVTEGANGQPASDARFDEVLEDTSDARVIVTFPTAGVVSITCRFHPAMALTVTVTGDSPAASPATAPAVSPATAPSPSTKRTY